MSFRLPPNDSITHGLWLQARRELGQEPIGLSDQAVRSARGMRRGSARTLVTLLRDVSAALDGHGWRPDREYPASVPSPAVILRRVALAQPVGFAVARVRRFRS